MNITSMDMNSLFYTLFGKSPKKPVMDVIKEAAEAKSANQNVSSGTDWKELDENLNEMLGERIDFSKAIDPDGIKDYTIDSDISIIKADDRYVCSGSIALPGSQSMNSTKTVDRFEYSNSNEITVEADSVERLLDYDTRLDCNIRGSMTRAQLANYFGKIAERLDTAFSEGKFTQEEYDELNAGLMESYEKYISKCEYAAAGQQVGIIRALERRKQLFEESGNKIKKAPAPEKNIKKIIEDMNKHRLSLRERQKVQETAVVFEMLAKLERNSGRDDSKWKKLSSDLRQSVLDAVNNPENKSEDNSEPKKIIDKAEAKSETSEAKSAKSSNAGSSVIKPSADPEEIKRIGEEIHQQTEAFAEKYCHVDRKQMYDMLDTVRKGGSIEGGNNIVYGGENYKDWYDKDYRFKVYL